MKKILFLLLIAYTTVFAGNIERVTLSSNGIEADLGGIRPSISCDGKLVVFESYSNNLVDNDTNNEKDIFIKNIENNSIERIFIDNGKYSSPKISCDGKNVYFLYSSDNGTAFYQYDVITKSIVKLLSFAITQFQISSDNNHIVFATTSKVEQSDNNQYYDIYLLTVSNGDIKRVSSGINGEGTNGNSYYPSVSYDGTFVSFNSEANNLVDDDTNNLPDIFVKNIQTGEIFKIEIPNNELNIVKYGKYNQISNSGKYTLCLINSYYYSKSTDENNLEILVYDNFEKKVNTVIYDDHLINDYIDTQFGKFTLTDTFFTYSNYKYDMRTGLKTKIVDRKISSKVILSGNGRYAVFESDLSNLTDNDNNAATDIFIKDLYPAIKSPQKTYTYQYEFVKQPLIDEFYGNLKPLGLGDVDNGILNIRIALPNFEEKSNVYIAIYAPNLNNNIFMLNSNNQLVPYNGELVPWKYEIINGVSKQTVFGDIDISSWPSGKYYFMTIVSNYNDFNKRYEWITYFTK